MDSAPSNDSTPPDYPMPRQKRADWCPCLCHDGHGGQHHGRPCDCKEARS